MARGSDPSPWTVRLLQGTGWALIGVAVVGLLAEAPPGTLGSRIAGAALLATTGAVAIIAARLVRRQPKCGRRLGLLAAGGMLFIAWIATTRPSSNLFTVLLGLALLAVGSIVGWQLLRWRPGRWSSQAEDGPDVA
jgi:uncharacterized membrane protein HdeD (DUF308 family)